MHVDDQLMRRTASEWWRDAPSEQTQKNKKQEKVSTDRELLNFFELTRSMTIIAKMQFASVHD